MKNRLISTQNAVFMCVAVVLLLSCSGPSYGQSQKLRMTTCEENIALLEGAHRRANGSASLILIARLGANEMDTDLSRLRLYNAVVYLSDYSGLREKPAIVVGEGRKNRSTTLGLIEIYVMGRLFGTLLVPENSYLRVGSCEPPELDSPEQRRKRGLFYPEVDRNAALKEW